jgi:UDP-N-acetylmuramoylalanine-D-glutamate ligase
MRDQLDRFGEIDTTAKLLEELSSSAQDFVVLNAHDPRVKDMKTNKNSKKVYFGLEAKLKKDFITDDDWHRVDKIQKTDKADYLLVNSTGGSCSLSTNNQKYNLNLNL